jgi:hypothetical protein
MVQAKLIADRPVHEQESWTGIFHEDQGWNVEDCFISQYPTRHPMLNNERAGVRRNAARIHQVRIMGSTETLAQRVDSANAYFRRKAAEVLDDEHALEYLNNLYHQVVVDIPDSGISPDGFALGKIAAANFCEIGANAISITLSGRRFVESIRK